MNTTSPRFSIILTCYNLQNYVAEALKSIFNQNWQGVRELIIVNDCSTDASLTVIKDTINRYGSNWDIQIITNEKNLGVAGSFDAGLTAAKYEWIIEADGDDVQLPDRCSHTADLIQRYPEAEMIFLSQICVDSKGTEQYKRFMLNENFEEESWIVRDANDRALLFMGKHPSAPATKGGYGCSMAMKKKLLEHWGTLTEAGSPRCAQDPPWELRAFLCAPIVWSNQFACLYRSHDSNILNRQRENSSVADMVSNEEFMAKHAAFESITTSAMLKDLNQARKKTALSDWKQEDLKDCCQQLTALKLAQDLRSSWWNRGLLSRLFAAIRYKKQLPPQFSMWFINRILPVKWSMYLKKIIKRK